MFKTFNISKLLIILAIFLIVDLASCAGSKHSSYFAKKSQTSRVNSSMLGRNKYYFSTNYQKKLKKTFKK
jgi:hypothetical protein